MIGRITTGQGGSNSTGRPHVASHIRRNESPCKDGDRFEKLLQTQNRRTCSEVWKSKLLKCKHVEPELLQCNCNETIYNPSITNLREQQSFCEKWNHQIAQQAEKMEYKNFCANVQSGLWDKLFCMVICNFCTYITMEVDEVWHSETLKNDNRVEKNEITGLLSMLKI